MRDLIVDNYIIKNSIENILALLKVSVYNGKLKDIKTGFDNIVVSCPHHNKGLESKAACNIYIGNNASIKFGYTRCFVCGFQGDFKHFVAECLDSSEEYAKQWLLDNFEYELLENYISLGEDIDITKAKRTSKYSYLDPSILNQYQSYCTYLQKRKIPREICEMFNVKYDSKYRQVIFPCYDTAGNLIMLPKRAIDTKTFYLDKNIEKPLYCLDFITKHQIKKAIITEGPFDCLTAYAYGAPAIATLGNISSNQIKLLNNSCLDVLYLMFDNDAAGQNFANIIKRRVTKRIIKIDVPLPNGKKDLNELSKEEFLNCFKKI